MTLTDVEVVSLTFDLDKLACELSQQPIQTLIMLIERIDYHTADWHFFESLDRWMKAKLASEVDGPEL